MAVTSEIGANLAWTPGCGPDRTGPEAREKFGVGCGIGEIHTEIAARTPVTSVGRRSEVGRARESGRSRGRPSQGIVNILECEQAIRVVELGEISSAKCHLLCIC